MKSIFDIRDGDKIQPVFVPGTPYEVHTERSSRYTMAIVFRGGIADGPLSNELNDTFRGEEFRADTAHRIGKWLQGRSNR